MRPVIHTASAILILGSVLFAQGKRTPVDGSPPDGVLAEVRALRAEINQVAHASIRTQVLVGRLQLQEQRVAGAAEQLADTRRTLAAVQAGIAREQARVRQLEDAASRAADQARPSIQQAIREAGTHIDQQYAEALPLQQREAQLLRALQDSQGTWTHLSDQIDALERSLGQKGGEALVIDRQTN